MTIYDTWLGQVTDPSRPGVWLDYARGTEVTALEWMNRQPAGTARVVDWIAKGHVLIEPRKESEPARVRPPLPKPCLACGWQYDERLLTAHRAADLTLDPTPTHLCRPVCRSCNSMNGRHEDWCDYAGTLAGLDECR